MTGYMTNLVYLPTHSHPSKVHARVFFHRDEFRTILNIYSKHVASGEWKDYAIDAKGYMALFTVFRHSFDAPLFSIAKRLNGKKFEYLILRGHQTVKRSGQLDKILKEIDKPMRFIKFI